MPYESHIKSARILFVDDEPLALRATVRQLEHAMRSNGWHILTASNGDDALRKMREEAVDVLVTDLQMPGMSGAKLLMETQTRFAATIRIALSAHLGSEPMRAAIPYAHQFLAKPCAPHVLGATLESACRLRRVLASPELRRLVGASNALPSLPGVCIELNRVLSNANASSRLVAEIVEADIALSARVLQLVGSAFFGLPQAMTSIGGAVAYLGVETIRALVMALEIGRLYRAIPIVGFSMERVQRRSLEVGRLAARILGGHGADSSAALIAGMLQDVGQLLLASRCPEEYSAILKASRAKDLPVAWLEEETFGTSHAVLGSYLLGLWSLPAKVTEAVAYHHGPDFTRARLLDVNAALYLANCLIDNPAVEVFRGEPPANGRGVPLSYLRALAADAQFDKWRLYAQEADERSGQRPAVA